jgi:hypothetical protein
MQGQISIKQLTAINEVRILDSEFAKWYPWYTKSDYYEKCLEENQLGSRVTLLAFYDEELAGCCSLLYKSDYPYFNKHSIPEGGPRWHESPSSPFGHWRRRSMVPILHSCKQWVGSPPQ